MKNMKKSIWLIIALVLAVGLLQPPAASALTINQTDNFQDGTTQNWEVSQGGAPNPHPPVNVPTGGPAGDGDRYMLLTSVSTELTGGSRLIVINDVQWSGDILATGVGTITMDVNNFGATALRLRLWCADAHPAGSPFPNSAVSTNAVTLPAGSGWTAVTFPIDAASFTALTGTAAAALSNVVELRLMHNPNPTFPPPPADAQLGVDNITLAGTPFTPTQATYTRDGGGATTVYGFATAPRPFIAGTRISISAGAGSANLSRHGVFFFGSLALGNVAPPPSLSFTGTTRGANPTTLSKALTDQVFISQAVYSVSGGVLVVTADSSDQFPATPLVLTLKGLGSFAPTNFAGGTTVINNLNVPPKQIVVTSSLGGSDVAPVTFVP
jgi:hypothetical protein